MYEENNLFALLLLLLSCT